MAILKDSIIVEASELRRGDTVWAPTRCGPTWASVLRHRIIDEEVEIMLGMGFDTEYQALPLEARVARRLRAGE